MAQPEGRKVRLTRVPVERMLQIHHAIAAEGYPNASRFAREMEVSTKSIQRDLDFMRDRLGLPIEFDPVKNGYFYTEKVSSFPSLQLSEGELFAMVVAEKALQQYRGTSFEKPLVTAFQKMAQSLPETITVNMGDWDKTISFRTSAEPLLNLEIFDQLARAAARQQTIRVIYRKPGVKQPEVRTVDPYQLANVNGEWFLFAYDHSRKALRTFVPMRMQSVQSTGDKFKRPDNFSLEKTLKDSFGVRSGTQVSQVVIRFSPKVADYIREKRWHRSQKLTELKDGSLDLQIEVSNFDEIQRWVLGWGGEAVVLKPKELKESIQGAAKKILKS